MNPSSLRTPSRSYTWKPLLEGESRAAAESALQGIDQALRDLVSEHPSLAGGGAGHAIFQSYLAAGRPGQGHEQRALGHLDSAVEALGESVLGPGLYSGFSGIAWAAEHLQRRLPGMDAGEDLNEAIDEALLGCLEISQWLADYDLISGLVGFGVYALDRLERPTGMPLALRILDHLEALKVPMDDGWTWATAPELLPEWQRRSSPNGYYNLGLAHGMPGVIALLGHFYTHGVAPARSEALLRGAVRWLLAQQQPSGSASCFATVRSIGVEDHTVASRVAWCYGDLGLCLALLIAARALGEATWEATALDIARKSALRDDAHVGALDACICHGHAGNAHLFNRLWQATGDELFAKTARRWITRCLEMRRPGKGVAGFQAWMPGMGEDTERDPWVDDPNLLEGAAGIGLMLAAALDPVEPAWDRMLLVDVPPALPEVR